MTSPCFVDARNVTQAGRREVDAPTSTLYIAGRPNLLERQMYKLSLITVRVPPLFWYLDYITIE